MDWKKGKWAMGYIITTGFRWLRKQFKVDNRLTTMTKRSTNTIVTGITTTNNNVILIYAINCYSIHFLIIITENKNVALY
jgi:hypothetical protein